MSLSPDESAAYAARIDAILAASDLQTVSAKRIRQTLQDQVAEDLSLRKKAINLLIQGRFDRYTAKHEVEPAANGNGTPSSNGNGASKTGPSTNGVKVKARHSPPIKSPSSSASPRPAPDFDDERPAKKVKRVAEDDDAAYAARLQAELNNSDRPTRGGGARPSKPAKSAKTSPKKKRKSAARVSAADDSDLDTGSGADTPKTERGGAFNVCGCLVLLLTQKPMYLSQPLKDLLGEETVGFSDYITDQLSRPQIVKRIWAHIKQHGLQNPDDKRMIICDEPLRAVFKKESVHMFTMVSLPRALLTLTQNKILSGHVTPIED